MFVSEFGLVCTYEATQPCGLGKQRLLNYKLTAAIWRDMTDGT